MQTRTDDLRVIGYTRLISPREMKQAIPVSEAAGRTVLSARETIGRILLKEDRRLLLVAGPCSIHDEKGALEYAERLLTLQQKVGDVLYIVMRVYFEKPRTTIGWKGFVNDPGLDGSCDLNQGLRRARKLLQRINEMGLPAGTEMVEMVTPQYLADLVSWGAIGARTTESQAHRELASGLSMPMGYKNGTDGNLQSAIHAMVAARVPQTFIGVDQEGYACIVQTRGNPLGHIVLRGGKRPNYDPISIAEARLGLIGHRLPEAIRGDGVEIVEDLVEGLHVALHQLPAVRRIDGLDAEGPIEHVYADRVVEGIVDVADREHAVGRFDNSIRPLNDPRRLDGAIEDLLQEPVTGSGLFEIDQVVGCEDELRSVRVDDLEDDLFADPGLEHPYHVIQVDGERRGG